jgi:hypothetical protein
MDGEIIRWFQSGGAKMTSKQIHRSLAVAFLLCIAALGCNFMSMETVPTEESIRSRLGIFIVEGVDVVGVYQNLDVDSLVFETPPLRNLRMDFGPNLTVE